MLSCAVALCFLAWSAAPAPATEPLFVFTPVPAHAPPPTPDPPPTGYLNAPCGLGVDTTGRFYIADHFHDAVHVYSGTADYATPPVTGDTGYLTQSHHHDPLGGPCALALDSQGRLYAAAHHRSVEKHAPETYPPEEDTPYTHQGTIDASPATGVAVDPASDTLYVNQRTHVAAYDASGDPILDEGSPLRIGEGSLEDAYGVAYSAYPATEGFVYVADAADNRIEVFDSAGDTSTPVQVIDGSQAPAGSFTSLRDSSIAVDHASGAIYVVDNLEPHLTEGPHAIVHVFSADGTREGHLRDLVVHGGPSGLAVDNSTASRHPEGTQGRVYVTSGDTHLGGIYAYPPDAATGLAPGEPAIPPGPLGGEQPFPMIDVGGPAGQGSGVLCEGDSCQDLPPEPTDPTLTTLFQGLGNPPVRFVRAPRNCRPARALSIRLKRAQRRLARRARRSRRAGKSRLARRQIARQRQLRSRAKKAAATARRCTAANRRGARASAAKAGSGRNGAAAAGYSAPSLEGAGGSKGAAPTGASGSGATTQSNRDQSLLPAAAGFEAAVTADGGGPETRAGSHPYRMDLAVSTGDAELREVSFALPSGLILNPAGSRTCPQGPGNPFHIPRSSPLGSYSSGESCPQMSQVGVIEVEAAGGLSATFGLFNLQPEEGAAFQLGAAPFGRHLVFDAEVRAGGPEAFGIGLSASEIPEELGASALALSLWGVPWDASHNTQRGDCLNEAEPSFGFSKCTSGEPRSNPPRALLTLPTECGSPLSFEARMTTWQASEPVSAEAESTGAGGEAAPVSDCGSLEFESPDLSPAGHLPTEKASSPAGFVFRLRNDDPGLANPRNRMRSLVRRAVVELPDGVTLNPSLGAGLEVCTPQDLERESAFNPPGVGCPNGSKIGDFRVRLPYFDGFLRGGVYLAEPDDPDTSQPGAENPFDSLVGVYLIAKSAERGLLIRVPGELAPDPGDGTITATFEGLPQLPYADLEINFRSGQRAPLVSPPRCGRHPTRIDLSPWASGIPDAGYETDTQINFGIDQGPCPDGSVPPFSPGAVAGGVNSNVGSYTPYFVRLSRRDTEQEITSYSLVLPQGITGRLAGIPFCSDAAIAAARGRRGFEEIASPSCPVASQVGRTETGYGVGPALTYAPGRIYLAGPYNGQPLSLVTVNAATIGPFDLGTIVVRSAFAIDETTAQLRIDSGASDPIPHIVDGILLHLREIRLHIDRPRFTGNPTGCEVSELRSTLTGSGARFDDPADDSTASVRSHFQLLNCLELGFRPRLGLRLKGGPRRGAHPGLRVVLRARPGDASMKRIAVTMPRSLFLAQNHLRGICTRVQFAAERCPRNSVYGRAVVHTDLLDEPLRGPVRLRSSGNRLPDLVASLRSGEVKIVLNGRIGPSKSGGIRAFFTGIPDAPIERFVMHLRGGRRGLLVNSVNVCNSAPKARVKSLAQNNRGVVFTTRLRGKCGKFRQNQRERRKHRQKQRQGRTR